MNLLYIDLETTGIETHRARIVQIGIIYKGQSKSILVNPTIPIPPEASNIHKIFDSDVKGAPTFSDISNKILTLIEECDCIVGYNSDSFDIPILYTELLRCGKHMPIVPSIDIYQMWLKVEKGRKLSNAYFRFFGENFYNSHSAKNDIEASKKVMEEMVRLYKLNLTDYIKNLPF